ncbi:hypothetical protein IWW50_002333, partial [Coemansia erecta]
MYGHRRERSSLSTNCSQSSGHSRVLPFATARPLQTTNPLKAIAETPTTEPTNVYISENRRFAVAQPRRVITQPATFADPRTGYRATNKRHSASINISTLLGPMTAKHAVRARPIIGLGLTLNPADTLVKLQPRRSVNHTKPSSEVGRSPLLLTTPRKNTMMRSPRTAANSRSSIVLNEAFSYASPMLESCVSLNDLGSPRDADPQMVPLRQVRSSAGTPQSADNWVLNAQMAVDSWQSSPEEGEEEEEDSQSRESCGCADDLRSRCSRNCDNDDGLSGCAGNDDESASEARVPSICSERTETESIS